MAIVERLGPSQVAEQVADVARAGLGEHGEHVAGERLSAYVDRELEPEAQRWVERHLRGCDACRTVAQGYRTMGSRVRALPVRQVPVQLRRAFWQRVRVPTAPTATAPREQRAA